MQDNYEDFYRHIIKVAYPEATDIRHPTVRGGVCPVFLADINKSTKVFKFNTCKIACRNRTISNLLGDHDINVPQTTVCAYNSEWFERYDYCPDKTLFEYIQADTLTKQQIENVYKQALDKQAQMSEIKPIMFGPNPLLEYPDVFAASMRQKLSPWLVDFYAYFVRILATRGDMRLMHNDINPKNLLITPNAQLTKMLDLDSVATANESFALLMALRHYPLDNQPEMIEYYQDKTGRKVNEKAIMHGIKILDTLRNARRELDVHFIHTK